MKQARATRRRVGRRASLIAPALRHGGRRAGVAAANVVVVNSMSTTKNVGSSAGVNGVYDNIELGSLNGDPEGSSQNSSSAPVGPAPRTNNGPVNKLRNAVAKIKTSPVTSWPLNFQVNQPAEAYRPNVRGKELQPPPPPNVQPLSADRIAGMERKQSKAIDFLVGETQRAPAPSAIGTARQADKATEDHINALFGAGSTVGRQLLLDLQFTFPSNDQKARDGALLLAQALHAAVGNNADDAGKAWENITLDSAPDLLPAKQAREMNATLRAAAASPGAFDALWAVKSTRGHAVTGIDRGRELFQTALTASDKLLQMEQRNPVLGLAANSRGSIEEIAEAAQTRVDNSARALGSNEPPDTLACQALLYAAAHLNPKESPSKGKKKEGENIATTPQQAAGYLAWRNGFEESGPGTLFNETVHRMFKFTDYVNRAIDRPQPGFSREGLHAAANGFKALAGKNLSPLSAMQFGTAGADYGLADKAQENFGKSLLEGQKIVAAGLMDQARRLGGGTPQGDEAIVRACIVQHWANTYPGRKDIKLDATEGQAVLTQAQAMGATTAASFADSRMLKQKLNLKTLETWGADALQGQADKLTELNEQVSNARKQARAQAEGVPKHPTSQQLKDVAVGAMKNTIGIAYRHQGTFGIDLVPVVGIDTAVASFSVAPGAQLKPSYAQGKSLRFGTTSAGSEVFIGKDTKSAVQGGALTRVGGGFKLGSSRIAKATAGARVTVGHVAKEWSREEGVALRFPKGTPDQKKEAEKLIDFMFDKAAERRNGTLRNGPELWESLAQKYADNKYLSISYQTNNVDTVRAGASAAVSGRAGVADVNAGLTGMGGFEFAKASTERVDHTGRVPLYLANEGTRKTLQAQGGLTFRTPDIPVNQNSIEEVKLPAFGLLTRRMELNLGGEQGQVRVMIEEGKVNAKLSLQYNEYRNEADFFRRVAANRDIWDKAAGTDPKTALPAVDETGKPIDGKQTIDDFLESVRKLNDSRGAAGGNRAFLERFRLTNAAGKELDVRLSQLKLLERDTNATPGELDAVKAELKSILKAEGSWEPDRLAVFEVESHTEHRGADLILSGRSTMQAQSTLRYLAEVRLPGEYKAGEGPVAKGGDAGKKKALTLPQLKGLGQARSLQNTMEIPLIDE